MLIKKTVGIYIHFFVLLHFIILLYKKKSYMYKKVKKNVAGKLNTYQNNFLIFFKNKFILQRDI